MALMVCQVYFIKLVGKLQEKMLQKQCSLFQGHTLPKTITHANLILLPKKENTKKFADLRPICLSNFSNKVISRVITDKVEGLLPEIISPNQFGFIKGRSIVEKVLLT